MTILNRNRASKLRRTGPLVLGLALAVVIGGLGHRERGGRFDISTLDTARVQRTNLVSSVLAPGDVDSSEKTLIECEIEATVFSNGSSSMRTKGTSAIIELVPEGTTVEKGDILCRIDSSEYEEIVRQQEIEVQEDRAYLEGYRLDLESLEIRLREYRDGQLEQLKQQFQGQIALAEAELNRQKSRMEWSQRMLEIGYLPRSQFAAEEQRLRQAEIALGRNSLAFDNLIKYTAPKMLITLEGQIGAAKARFTYFQNRLRRNEQQLTHYRELVDRCTIRAPHSGFLIYANENDSETRIELGSAVRQGQDLFYLPDLTQMEISTRLDQTILQRVSTGMPARVRVEALPEALLEGEVVSVAPLPMTKRSWRQPDDVKVFEARIRLHAIPQGLMPGMTAEVQIQTARIPDALVIPPGALTVEGGREFCYLAIGDHLERREVVVGQYHPDMVEVLSGLKEGERVLTGLDRLESGEIQVVDAPPSGPIPGASQTRVSSTEGPVDDHDGITRLGERVTAFTSMALAAIARTPR